MKLNLAIPAAILLIVGAVAIVILKEEESTNPSTAKADKPKEQSEVGGPSSSRSDAGPGRSSRSVSDRSPSLSREGELVEKYGRARTAKARQVSDNVVAILDDVIAVGELMMKGGQQMGPGRRGMVNGLTRRMGIELSEEQQEKALALYDEWQQGELEKSKKTAMTLRDDPTAMMELFLAGDAKERGELDEADYAAIRDEAAGALGDILNPLDRENFRGDRRMAADENLMESFAGILDPDQAEKFSAFRAEQESSADQQNRGGSTITSMATMELDTLDSAVGSAKKMTSGFRLLIEGMGSLQEARPQNGQGSGSSE